MSEVVRQSSARSRLAVLALCAITGVAGLMVFGSSGAGARGATCEGQEADVVLLKPDTYVGGPANEVIVGSAGADSIHGRAGNDIICARGGGDLIGAGSGDDDLIGGFGADLLRGRRGVDFMEGDEEPKTKRGTQVEVDECHGHLPTPDPNPETGDTATGCEVVRDAINLDNS